MTSLSLPPARVEPEIEKRSPKSVSPVGVGVFLFPFLIVGLTTIAAYFIHRHVNVTAIPLVVVSVMICAWRWGLVGGVWAAVLAWFGYLFLFIPPALTFYIRDEKSAARMTELVVTSVITLWLTVGLVRSRKRIRSEHDHLREILRQLPSGVLIADARTRQVILANDQVEQIWDHAGSGPWEQTLVRALSRGEAVMNEEFEIRRRDGSRAAIQVNAAPVLDAEGRILEGVVTFQDVTERRRAEEAVRDLNSRLEVRVTERTSELEESVRKLDSFAYSVAHDFRAPLRGVSGLSQILLQDYSGRALDAEGQELLGRIGHCAQKMDTLITDLLSYSRITRSPVQIGRIETDHLVAGVVEQQREFLREREASVSVRSNLPAVKGHYEMLAHAVSNLLTNAVKFVAPGIQPKVDIWTEVRGDQVRLWLQDNGIGIEPGYHDRIFGIFQRLNPQDMYPGNGIGLAIAREAIERIGGKVGVESSLGNGSRFWIELPRAQD